jgi:hypothetical protein
VEYRPNTNYKQLYEKEVMLREITNGRGRIKEVKKVNMVYVFSIQE